MPTNKGFIKYGASPNDLRYILPFPSIGKALFQTERMVDSARNMNGVLVAQQVGRSLDKQNMGWDIIETAKWWEFNNFLESNGFFFYVEFFNYNRGIKQVKMFYTSSPQCDPFKVDEDTLIPKIILNAQVNIIDVGK